MVAQSARRRIAAQVRLAKRKRPCRRHDWHINRKWSAWWKAAVMDHRICLRCGTTDRWLQAMDPFHGVWESEYESKAACQ